MIQLLKNSGKFYKANLHTHTTISDGKWTPEQTKENYIKHGYGIIAFTDHNKYVDHSDLTDENFLAIASYEADINEEIAGRDFCEIKTYHLNIYAKDPKNFPGEIQHSCEYTVDNANELIKKANENGAIVCYNHPGWSLQTRDEFSKLKGLFAMEIYNHGCELEDGNGYASQAYSEMLWSGQKIHCVATDDNHDVYPIDDPNCDSFGGYVMINLDELNYKNTITALENGDFYSSTGAEFSSISLENNILKVETSPCTNVYVQTGNRKAYSKNSATTFTKCEFELSGMDEYIRVVAVNKDGKRAMSNAYWL